MSAVGGTVGDTDAAPSTAETVAGFLAAFAMAAAVVALAWHPLRLLAPALVLSMLAAGIGGRAKGLAGAARLIEALDRNGGNGHVAIPEAPPVPAPAPVEAPPKVEAPAPAVPDEELIGAIAAAMSLVKAFRTHGHLAAHIDPLGSEPHG